MPYYLVTYYVLFLVTQSAILYLILFQITRTPLQIYRKFEAIL